MNGEPGDTSTPVRRSGRARKPNSRFIDDEVEGCFRKIVSGIGSPDCSLASPSPAAASHSSPGSRSRKGVRKRNSQCEEEAGDNEKIKCKAELPSDHTQQGEVKVIPVLSETFSADKKLQSRTSPIVVVNGVDEEIELKNSVDEWGKVVGVETGRRGRNVRKDEPQCSSTETKRRGNRKRGKERVIEEDDGSVNRYFNAEPAGVGKESGNVDKKKEDPHYRSLPDKQLGIVVHSSNDEEPQCMTDIEVQSRNESSSSSSSNSVVVESQLSGSACDEFCDDVKATTPDAVKDTINVIRDSEDNVNRLCSNVQDECSIHIIGSEEAKVGDEIEKQELTETGQPDQIAEVELEVDAVYLANGDKVVNLEKVPYKFNPATSSSAASGTVMCEKRNLDKVQIDFYNEIAIKDQGEAVFSGKVSSDSSMDGSSSSNSDPELRDKMRPGKSPHHGRRRLTKEDSTDSTDSDTASPARRRGRSRPQVLSLGLGEEKKSSPQHTKSTTTTKLQKKAIEKNVKQSDSSASPSKGPDPLKNYARTKNDVPTYVKGSPSKTSTTTTGGVEAKSPASRVVPSVTEYKATEPQETKPTGIEIVRPTGVDTKPETLERKQKEVKTTTFDTKPELPEANFSRIEIKPTNVDTKLESPETKSPRIEIKLAKFVAKPRPPLPKETLPQKMEEWQDTGKLSKLQKEEDDIKSIPVPPQAKQTKSPKKEEDIRALHSQVKSSATITTTKSQKREDEVKSLTTSPTKLGKSVKREEQLKPFLSPSKLPLTRFQKNDDEIRSSSPLKVDKLQKVDEELKVPPSPVKVNKCEKKEETKPVLLSPVKQSRSQIADDDSTTTAASPMKFGKSERKEDNSKPPPSPTKPNKPQKRNDDVKQPSSPVRQDKSQIKEFDYDAKYEPTDSKVLKPQKQTLVTEEPPQSENLKSHKQLVNSEFIPLPPKRLQNVELESESCGVETEGKGIGKGKRERASTEQQQHGRDDKGEERSVLFETPEMPKSKKRREDELEGQALCLDEDEQKRKRLMESKEEESRKRRKVEDRVENKAVIENPHSLVMASRNVEDVTQSLMCVNTVLSLAHIPLPNESTGKMSPKKDSHSIFGANHSLEGQSSAEDNLMSVKETKNFVEPKFRHEESTKSNTSDTENSITESKGNLTSDSSAHGGRTIILSENMSPPKESLQKREDLEVKSRAFTQLSSSIRIPFISDKTEDSSAFEIPGLSILAAQNKSSAYEKAWKTKEQPGSSDVSGSLKDYESATFVKEVIDVTEIELANRDSRNVGSLSLSDSNNSNNANEPLKMEVPEADKLHVKSDPKPEDDIGGISGSKVEEIHLTDEEATSCILNTEVKMECEDMNELKMEDAFGSKVEEVKLTEEEIRDMERKRQLAEEEKVKRNKEVVEQRLKSFTHLQDNLYLSEKRKSKRSKEVRRMVCDCSLSKEEVARGDVGCGDDCLNRLLMIECGSRCPLKDRCTNKRFQNREYGDVEVFNADEKGCGLRACTDLPPGTFIMEYVGEVFDTKEFKRRRKEYARDHTAHFYFMALKSDQLIDATRKGNISRFINHSCDPNAETQKWTVNGELRVGFFSKKQIAAGEEINFDYRLERYGREPQRCFCGTSVCRGWLGEAPDEKTKEERDEERRKEERDRRKKEERRAFFEDIDLEDEIEKLNSHKLRNRQDTLNLSRLLVRVEDFGGRMMLLQLLQTGEAGCRRLFLDYHGLKVLWSLMADLTLSHHHTRLKIEILKTLECLPITNKTQLTDSRVLALVERWSTQQPDPSTTTTTPTSTTTTVNNTTTTTTTTITTTTTTATNATTHTLLPPPPPVRLETTVAVATVESSDSDTNKKSSDTSEESDSEVETKATHNMIEASSADDSSMDSEAEQPGVMSGKQVEGMEEESSDSNQSDGKENTTNIATSKEGLKEEETGGMETDMLKEKEAQELLELHRSLVTLALKLLDTWKNLKEFFRIPKKERIEMMKEHEREVDRGYKEYLDREQDSDRDCERDRKDKDRDSSWYSRRDYYDRRRRSPDRDKDRDRDRHGRTRAERNSRDDRSSDSPKMSKEQRRQLFELKVQQEEEEAKQRKMQEEMWAMHVDRCRHLGHDPYLTPIFDPTYQYYWDPGAASWQPYTGSGNSLRHSVPYQDPNIPVPAGYGQHKNESDGGSPMTILLPGQPQGSTIHVGHLPSTASDAAALSHIGSDDPLNPANIPLPGEIPAMSQASPSQPLPGQAVPCEGTPPQGAKVLSIPLPGEMSGGTVLPTQIELGATSVEGEEEPPPPPPGPITIQLPPRWKIARDTQGHVYFYHVKTRTSQWEPPTLDQHNQLMAELGSESDSDSSSSDTDSTSTSDSEDFSSEEEEEEVVETVTRSQVSDEKMIRRVHGKKRRSEALVQERVISPIMEIDREAARRERREAKERAREEARQERQEEQNSALSQQQQKDRLEGTDAMDQPTKSDRHDTSSSIGGGGGGGSSSRPRREKVKSKERAATAIADNSETARKIKDNFRSKMATFIVSVLNPYRRGDCREGKITCTEDFKYLARKLTHFVMVKELKQLHSIDALECSDSVKHKTKDFVRKYMGKYGSVFKRDPNDTKEY